MFLIREAEWLAPKVRQLVVEAPRVAQHHLPGHFVIVRVREGGERIPLTIAASDAEAGTITLVVQVVGATTEILCSLEKGEHVLNVAGPLGKPDGDRELRAGHPGRRRRGHGGDPPARPRLSRTRAARYGPSSVAARGSTSSSRRSSSATATSCTPAPMTAVTATTVS